MRKKYQATDASGRVHTRSTVSRTYTHCVVVHFMGGTWPSGEEYPPFDEAFWCGRRELAVNTARRYNSNNISTVTGVEILEVQK